MAEVRHSVESKHQLLTGNLNDFFGYRMQGVDLDKVLDWPFLSHYFTQRVEEKNADPCTITVRQGSIVKKSA